jgi:hypothetical protein
MLVLRRAVAHRDKLAPPDPAQHRHVRRHSEATRGAQGHGSASQVQISPPLGCSWSRGSPFDHADRSPPAHHPGVSGLHSPRRLYRDLSSDPADRDVRSAIVGCRAEGKINRKEAEALIIDRIERAIQRPGADPTQQEHYSAKKKRHTVKTEHIVARKDRIAGASPSFQAASTSRRLTSMARGCRNRRASMSKMSTKTATRSIEARSSHTKG